MTFPRGSTLTAGHARAIICDVFRIAFLAPQIGPNSGNAIRTSAATGCELHLIKPLGFDMSDRQLRRAGLDYHDLATVQVHESFDSACDVWGDARIYALTTTGQRTHSAVAYEAGDVLLFGTEQTGLPAEVLDDLRITEQVRIPMLPARRSLNLANSAAVVAYEAWRQHDYRGAAPQGNSMSPGFS